MAITYVGGANSTSASATSLSVDVSGISIQQDDFILAVCHGNDTSGSITDNNGANSFTESFQESNPSSGTGQIAFFERVAGASEPTSYSFSLNSADRFVITLSVFRGVDTAGPWDVKVSATTRAFDNTGTNDTPTTPSLTTGENNCWGIAAYFRDGSSTFSAYTNSYANEVEPASPDQANAHVSREFTTAGNQGTTACTISAANIWVAHQFSIAPKVGTIIEVPVANSPLW